MKQCRVGWHLAQFLGRVETPFLWAKFVGLCLRVLHPLQAIRIAVASVKLSRSKLSACAKYVAQRRLSGH